MTDEPTQEQDGAQPEPTPTPAMEVIIGGYFAVRVTEMDPDSPRYGEVVAESDSKNLVLNTGLDFLGANAINGFSTFLKISTDTAAPVVTDTALPSVFATSPSLAGAVTNIANAQGGAGRVWSYTFPTGTFNGTTTIAKVGADDATGLAINSAALLMDGSGGLAPVTPTATQTLTVSYRLFVTPSQTDVSGSTTFNGATLNFTLRPSNVDVSSGTWGSGTNPLSSAAYTSNLYPTTSTLGPVTGKPSGAALANALANANPTYATGSYKTEVTFVFPVSAAAQTYRYVTFEGPIHEYQLQFGTDLVKTASSVMTFPVTLNWSRG